METQRQPLNRETFEQAKRMLRNGASVRQVAAELQISVTRAVRIRQGKSVAVEQGRLANVRRCKDCGRLIEHPCRACAAENN